MHHVTVEAPDGAAQGDSDGADMTAQPAGTKSPQLAGGAPRRAHVLLTLNAASENFVGETPYAYHAEPEVTLVLPAGGPAGGDRRLALFDDTAPCARPMGRTPMISSGTPVPT